MSIYHGYISLILYRGILPQRKIYIHNIQRYLHSSPKSLLYFILISPTLCTTTSTVPSTQILCIHRKCVFVDWFLYLVVSTVWSGASMSSSIWGLVRNAKSPLSDPYFRNCERQVHQSMWTRPPGDFHEH